MMIVIDGNPVHGSVDEIYELIQKMKPTYASTSTTVSIPSIWVPTFPEKDGVSGFTTVQERVKNRKGVKK